MSDRMTQAERMGFQVRDVMSRFSGVRSSSIVAVDYYTINVTWTQKGTGEAREFTLDYRDVERAVNDQPRRSAASVFVEMIRRRVEGQDGPDDRYVPPRQKFGKPDPGHMSAYFQQRVVACRKCDTIMPDNRNGTKHARQGCGGDIVAWIIYRPRMPGTGLPSYRHIEGEEVE
jgi:hypothetical protein